MSGEAAKHRLGCLTSYPVASAKTNMASKGNVVVQLCRFFLRHPARILFILLLVLLIMLSRILHSPRMDNTALPKLADHRQIDATVSLVEASSSLQEGASVADSQTDEDSYNVLMTLVKVGMTSPLARSFRRCVNSICAHATVALTFHVVADEVGRLTTQDVFRSAAETCKHNFSVDYYSVETVNNEVGSHTKHLQELFSSNKQSYYSQPVFFLSVAAHFFLPRTISRIIMLDSDLEFRSDIAKLFHHFTSFDASNIFGLAHEQQPVYRHIFHMYRKENPDTRIGAPPPYGLTGFNSGVLLIALERMRNSQLYHQILTGHAVRDLAHQYQFQGHLGDQDFYTLIGVEHEELFYTLPCSWNRQLCTWWRDNGYSDVFQSYHNCSGPIHVYHGNCRTEIPEE